MLVKEVQALYSKRTKLYHRLFFNLLKYDLAVRQFFYENKTYLRADMNILDAGCGSGTVTKALYSLTEKQKLTNITFHGFDLTKNMLNWFQHWIRKKQIKTVFLKQANVLLLNEQLPAQWNKYPLIVSSAMLEYVPKPQMKLALTNLKQRLKPGGIFLLFITKNNWLNKFLINKWWKANMYGKQELEKLLSRAGYKKIKFKKFPSPYAYLNHWGFIVEAKN